MTALPVPFVDLEAQYAAIADDLEAVALGSLRETAYILGRDVARFEEEFAAYCEAPHAVGVDSGISAIELALRAFGVGAGDEVITQANTFVATALAISSVGARPVLVDAEPDFYGIDLEALRRAITPRTKAILPVHLYGQPVDMDPLMDLARERDLVVVEDACQAHGARYKGRRAGSLGHAAAFSFYPSKNLGACGDGGMIVTGDGEAAERMRSLRNYGQREKYHHVTVGFNRRLDTLQASILRVKLRHLDRWNAERRRWAELYRELLPHTEVALPREAPYAESVWHLYVIESPVRDELRAHLAEQGISTGIHYPIPIHLQPAYRDLGYRRGDFPVTERTAERILSLPMYAELTPEMVERVAQAVREGLASIAAQPMATMKSA